MGDFPYLDYLTNIYRDKAAHTQLWTDYLKAHGLATACLARHPTAERQQRVYNIEELWYNDVHPLSYEKHVKLTEAHKRSLNEFRRKTAESLGLLEAQHEHMPTDDLNIGKWLDFVDNVFVSSAECTQGFIDLSRAFIKSSIDVLAQANDHPPCSFAVIGFGSVARGEATPFSDLEYAFVVEREDPYFTRLAVDGYFRIGNMGESPLKCFNISELSVNRYKGSLIHFVDQPPVNGYKIDGISPKAGNIPTGSGVDGDKKLILTVEGFMTYYESALMAEADPKVPGDMSDLLSSSVLIMAHKGGERLYQDFLDKRKRFERDKAASSNHAKRKRLSTIEIDIVNHNFLPELKFNVKHADVKVKSDVFRYPTLLCTNLRISLNLDTTYPWETLQDLLTQGIISKHNHSYLKIVLGLSIFVRTSAYTALGTQQELLSLYPKVQNPISLDDRYYIARNVFFVLGRLLIPIKSSILKSVKQARRDLRNSVADFDMALIIRSVVEDFKVSHDDFLLKAEVHNFMGDWKAGLKTITDANGEVVLNDPVKYVEAVRKVYGTSKADPLEKHSLELCASLLQKDEDLLGYCMMLVTYCQPLEEVACWNRNAAECLVQLRKYKGACVLVDQILTSLCKLYELKTQDSLVEHTVQRVKTANSENFESLTENATFIAEVYQIQSTAKIGLHGEKENTKEGLPAEALNHLRSAETIYKELEHRDIDVRYDLAEIYNKMYTAYRENADYIKALETNLKYFEMCQVLYGANSVHNSLLQCYNNIGNTCGQLGEIGLRDLYWDKTVFLLTQVRGDTVDTGVHNLDLHHVSDTFHLIGKAHHKEQRYSESLKYLRQALASREQQALVRVSDSYCAIAKVFLDMGNYSEAIEHNELCIASRVRYYGEETAQTDIATAFDDLGFVYCEVGRFEEALQYHLKALAMNESLAESTVRHIQSNLYHTLHCVGAVASRLGQFARAHEYLNPCITRILSGSQYFKLLLDISACRYSEKQYRYAIQFCDLALKKSKIDDHPALAGQINLLAGQCYMKLDADRYRDKAYRHLDKSCVIFEGMVPCAKVNHFLSGVFLSLAQLMFRLLQPVQALVSAQRALKLSQNVISNQDMTTPAINAIHNQALSLMVYLISVRSL